jgi:hypothetical protein
LGRRSFNANGVYVSAKNSGAGPSEGLRNANSKARGSAGD